MEWFSIKSHETERKVIKRPSEPGKMSRLKIATNIQLEARENASEQIVIELSFAFD